ATYQHVFADDADVSFGPHVIQARVTIAEDVNRDNDSLARFFNAEDAPFVTLGAGYEEDFEASDAGWTTTGSLSSWERGWPMTRFIPNAASGTNAWATSLTGNFNDGEMSFLVSPCFDFTGASTDPTLTFAHIFTLGDFVGSAWVEVLTPLTGDWVR